MVLFNDSMDKFQKSNEWSIKQSIIVLKYCVIQVILFNAIRWFYWNIRVLVLFNHRLIIVILFFSSTVSVHNELENKVVVVVFAYPWCEGGGSVDLDCVLPDDSMNILGNDREFMVDFVIKF